MIGAIAGDIVGSVYEGWPIKTVDFPLFSPASTFTDDTVLSIIAFLASSDLESAVRNAVSLGGDTDTMACIAGAIAQAFYGDIPERILTEMRNRLTADLLEVVDAFNARFGVRY